MTYEILSMNELDTVSGGTNGEYKEAFNIDERHKVNPFYINERR